MTSKQYMDEPSHVFSVAEESGFFRLKMEVPDIGPQNVEDFLDTTVEWLSTNPAKGILIDFDGVKSVSDDFVAHLLSYYEEIKNRGLYVRFVNVSPSLEAFVEPSNITVVISQDLLPPEKPVLSARDILHDLARNVSDEELMVKHGLSAKGLKSMYTKLLKKGLITKKQLAKRWGIETDMITLAPGDSDSRRVTVDAKEVLKDLGLGRSDSDIMAKYHLSYKGLQSLMKKLRERGLISREIIAARKKGDEDS